MSHAPCPMPLSHVPCPMPHVPRPMSHAPCPTSHVPCPTSHVPCPYWLPTIVHHSPQAHHWRVNLTHFGPKREWVSLVLGLALGVVCLHGRQMTGADDPVVLVKAVLSPSDATEKRG